MTPEPWSTHLSLPAFATSARAAREFVNAQLRGHNLEDASGSVELVTSELVTNAVRHANTACTLTVYGELSEVRVSVHDDDPLMGTFAPDVLTSLGGRGLRIADALSDLWGVDHEPTGKSVWAVFTLAPAPRA